MQSHSLTTSTDPGPETPALLPGETALTTWPQATIFVSATETPTPCASLAAFYGVGTIYLTTTCLHFVLHPPPPTATTTTVSIPLLWLQTHHLQLHRPFFDTPHISATLFPTTTAPSPNPVPSPLPISQPCSLRLHLLDHSRNPDLLSALRTALGHPKRLLRDAALLRAALNDSLVPTTHHYAFFDPHHPDFLYLATQMAYPSQPSPAPL